MTAVVRYQICCDAPGCTARFDSGHKQVGPTRILAKEAGWIMRLGVRRNGTTRQCPVKQLDLCPLHQDVVVERSIPQASEEPEIDVVVERKHDVV